MSKHSDNLASVLNRYGYSWNYFASQTYFGAGKRRCRNFQAIELGRYCFLFSIVDGTPVISFLQTGKDSAVTEKQFETMITTLKQFPVFIYRGKDVRRIEDGRECIVFCKEDVYIHILDVNYRLNVADFLVSEGLLPKKWRNRHKKFLIADSEKPETGSMWFSNTVSDPRVFRVHRNGFIDSVFIQYIDFDLNDKWRLNRLYHVFSDITWKAKYVYFPYSNKHEKCEFSIAGAIQFLALLQEVVKYERKNTAPETVTLGTLRAANQQ
jgi:hypothetical protein